jgi:hypothetical protein
MVIHADSISTRSIRHSVKGTNARPLLSGLAWLACGLASLSGCHDTEAENKKLAEIQHQADEKISQAQHAADENVAALQKQLDQVRQEAADAAAKMKAQADDAISKAQQSADEQAKAAEAALVKARGAFKEEGRLQLAQLNKEVTELSSKSSKATAKVKADVAKAMKQIVTQQKDIAKDIAAFDSATIDTLKKAKAKLTQDLAVMKATIHAARAKVP